MTVGEAMEYTVGVGISYQHETSKEVIWGWSVTRSVEGGLTVGVATSSKKLGVTISGSIATSNTDAWTQATNYTFKYEFYGADVGKRAWKWVFEPTDTCGFEEEAVSEEIALTEGSYREPCCVSGWALDHPESTRCKDEESKISNEGYCSVR